MERTRKNFPQHAQRLHRQFVVFIRLNIRKLLKRNLQDIGDNSRIPRATLNPPPKVYNVMRGRNSNSAEEIVK